MFEQYNHIMTLRFTNADTEAIAISPAGVRQWLEGGATAYNALIGQGGSGGSGALIVGDNGFLRVSSQFGMRHIMTYADTTFNDQTVDAMPDESLEVHTAFEAWNSATTQWDKDFEGSNLYGAFEEMATNIINAVGASPSGLSDYADGGTIALASVNVVVFNEPQIAYDTDSGA